VFGAFTPSSRKEVGCMCFEKILQQTGIVLGKRKGFSSIGVFVKLKKELNLADAFISLKSKVIV
jgi:hypothetical protein